jgi:hypothetical protein
MSAPQVATLNSGQKLRALPEKAGLSHAEAKRDPSADPVLEADGSLHPRQQNAAEENYSSSALDAPSQP